VARVKPQYVVRVKMGASNNLKKIAASHDDRRKEIFRFIRVI
jgi:hypothetical protein